MNLCRDSAVNLIFGDLSEVPIDVDIKSLFLFNLHFGLSPSHIIISMSPYLEDGFRGSRLRAHCDENNPLSLFTICR